MKYEMELSIGGTRCFINAPGDDRLYIHIGPVGICVSNREERKALIAALVEADAMLDDARKDDVA